MKKDTNKEIEEAAKRKEDFERMMKRSSEIEREVEHISKEMGVDLKNISNLLDNPSNFKNEKEWKETQEKRKDFLKNISRELAQDQNVKKKKVKKANVNKLHRKAMGKKKGWISM